MMVKELGDSHSGWSVQSTHCEFLRSHSVLKFHSGVGCYVQFISIGLIPSKEPYQMCRKV